MRSTVALGVATMTDFPPQLCRLAKMAKHLDCGADFLREQLPDGAVRRIGRRWFVEVEAVSEWLETQRPDSRLAEFRHDVARRGVRQLGALLPATARSGRGSSASSAGGSCAP